MQRRQWCAYICVLILLSLNAWFPTPVVAQSDDSGINIQNALIDVVMGPGQSYVHNLVFSMGTGATTARNLVIEARGFVQQPDGGYRAVPAEEDVIPNSARPFVRNIDVMSFLLEPGKAQPINVTIETPAELGPNTYYGAVFVYSEGDAGTQVQFIIPIVLTPRGMQPAHTGEITGLEVSEIVSGQPIEVSTTFVNQGNHHVKAQNRVTIRDAQGREVTTLTSPMSGSSLVPGFPHLWVAKQGLTGGAAGLPMGSYVAESVVVANDGQVLATKSVSFGINTIYLPFVSIDENSLVIAHFQNEVPGKVDAWDKAGVELTFSDTGPVTGTVAIASYPDGQAPSEGDSLSQPLGEGGIGKQGVRYLALRIEGFSQGNVLVSVGYDQNDLTAVNPNSLLITHRTGGHWSDLERIQVFSGAGRIEGQARVSEFGEDYLLVVAGDAGGNVPAAAANDAGTLPLGLILGGGGVLLLGLVAFLLLRGRAPATRASGGAAD